MVRERTLFRHFRSRRKEYSGRQVADGRVLIVDNDPDILKTLGCRLISEKFEVTTALCGEIALRKVHKLKPNLIILDLVLPGIDGYEVCRLLKKDRRYKDIPIVMLTVKDQADDRLLGIDAGADGYITKPYVIDELLREIRRQLFLAGRK